MIKGPQGTGQSFLRKVEKLIAMGKTELQARRIASGTSYVIKKSK